MIDIRGITKSYGTRDLLTDITFQIGFGERVGIVGRNGTGKTTLLKILSGEETPDSGSVILSNGIRLGYLQQDLCFSPENTIYGEMLTVFDELLTVRARMTDLEAKMAELGSDADSQDFERLMREYTRLNERFEAEGGYTLESRIRNILNGLGFKGDRQSQKVATLSGGEKTRVNLGKLLLQEPDFIMLDEPTNHLDVKSTEWLEDYLANYKKGLVVVSHDRYFLDKVVNRIVEIFDGRAYCYKGNYTVYLQRRAEELERQAKEYEAYVKDQARQKEIIDRFMQYGLSYHTRAASKKKLLEKMETVEKPREDGQSMGLKLQTAWKSGSRVLTVDKVSKSFGQKTVLSSVSFDVRRGERIAIVGGNGAGKSTLLRILTGSLSQDSGEIRFGTGVSVGYYDQEQGELGTDRTVLEEFMRETRLGETKARTILGSFLFRGDDVFKTISMLSGGERSRLKLAKVVISNPNFLVLDEPTNHLDVAAIEALESALLDYTGTLLFVSHDRYFVNKIATKVGELSGCRLQFFEGDYDYYLEKRNEICSAALKGNPGQSAVKREAGPSLRDERIRQREQKQREKRIQEIEEKITELEVVLESVSNELADSSLYQDFERCSRTQARYDSIKQELDDLYREWDELTEV